MTVLAIALKGTPVEGAVDPEEDEEDSVWVLAGAPVDGDNWDEVVGDGIYVEDSAFSFRQDLSSLAPTFLMSETPPNPPCASRIRNIASVPAGIETGQLNRMSPSGTGTDSTLPPGTITSIVTGCTAS